MTSVVLLRTHRFRAPEREFALRLQRESGLTLHVLADETQGTLETGPFPKISISPRVIRDLGLPCPRDFAWRCGDYGVYAARSSLPEVSRFWLVEPDVWFSVPDIGPVFARLEALEADFLAPHLRPANRAHFWFPTMGWAGTEVYRCSFALCGFSAAAVDICLAERRRLARYLPARIMWANDETFVATTVGRAGLTRADMNGAGLPMCAPICTEESFGFAVPHRGETLARAAHDGLIYHPVLWGADYERKAQRIARGLSLEEIARLKLQRGMNRLLTRAVAEREPA
jgi:hypothetical protein